jgi:predicted nucleic acid-binding protein
MPTELVCDASALFELLVGDRGIAVAEAMDGAVVHAPHLAAIECMETLRHAERESDIAPDEATMAVGLLLSLDIVYWAIDDFADRVWSLRHNLSAYDAAYVALAERLDAPLLTFDSRLARAPGPRCEFLLA